MNNLTRSEQERCPAYLAVCPGEAGEAEPSLGFTDACTVRGQQGAPPFIPPLLQKGVNTAKSSQSTMKKSRTCGSNATWDDEGSLH